ncbi:MAG: outer membrane lipoprotein carrier protein LolA [Deltaproteobacteria bacterium]|nr:outer membrane lipoprotein carrier protein LolA [Deltaproteobacteria bacterium]
MRKILLLIPALIMLIHPPVSAEDTLSNILQGIKGHYGHTSGLSVPYTRDVMTRSMSMLGAQTEGDLASGIIHFKSPHFLRLDQEKPTPEIIIANDNILWWYIPAKKAAHRYRAEDFGRELRLLSDIFCGLAAVKDSFQVQLLEPDGNKDYQLTLVPDPPWQEIDRIILTVSPEYEIRSVRIFNALGSVTRFNLGNFTLGKTFKKGFFQFTAPPGVNVIVEGKN